MSKAATPQPPPTPGTTDIYPLVIADIEARVAAGREKYGMVLQAFNGRDALWDRYQEQIDAVMYTRQEIAEREARENDTDDSRELKLEDVLRLLVRNGINFTIEIFRGQIDLRMSKGNSIFRVEGQVKNINDIASFLHDLAETLYHLPGGDDDETN